jgi:pimeloyl-ACP methyl ester carboxylesterase
VRDGISYGTLLGRQYAGKFGDHVRAVVLDSTIDHSVDTRHFVADRATAADRLPVPHNWLRDRVFGGMYGSDWDDAAQFIADTVAGRPRTRRTGWTSGGRRGSCC